MPCHSKALPSAFGLYLLNHLWVLLHDVQEPVALLGQRCGPLLGAARQLLEEIGDDVVQTGAAACANHGVCRKREDGDSGTSPAFTLLRETPPLIWVLLGTWHTKSHLILK